MFKLQTSSNLDMSFEAFTELYIYDVKNRLKENTWLTKEHFILPSNNLLCGNLADFQFPEIRKYLFAYDMLFGKPRVFLQIADFFRP